MHQPQRCAVTARVLVVIGVGGRALVGEEVGGIEGRENGLERKRRLGQIKAIRKIVGWPVSVSQRGQLEISLDELQDAAEVMCDVRNVSSLGVR